MLKNTIICAITILLLFACNRVEKKQTENTAIANDSAKIKPEQDTLASVTQADSDVYYNAVNTELKEEFNDSLLANFSDLSTEDKFVFNVPKGNINKTTSVFQIFNNAGELIYESKFQTSYLANGYDLRHIRNDDEMEKYILSKAKEILDRDSFVVIPDKNKMDADDILNWPKEDFIDYDAFIECRNNKTPLFTISRGEEDTTYIGYSKKLKKAVDITGCC